MERIADLTNPTYAQVDALIEMHRDDNIGPLTSPLVGDLRVAIDTAFRHDRIEDIFADLEKLSQESAHDNVRQWAKKTLDTLHMRSPTSLKVALTAIRRGRDSSLLEALQMELNIATAFCVRPLIRVLLMLKG